MEAMRELLRSSLGRSLGAMRDEDRLAAADDLAARHAGARNGAHRGTTGCGDTLRVEEASLSGDESDG